MRLFAWAVGFTGVVRALVVNALPMRPCRRCGVSHRNANGFCDNHQALAVGWSARQRGKTTTQRGYGHSWRVIRDRILKRDKYCCVKCRELGFVVKATDVDHIVPKEFGGDDSDENLQSLCKVHHKEKTQAEAKQGRLDAMGGGITKV